MKIMLCGACRVLLEKSIRENHLRRKLQPVNDMPRKCACIRCNSTEHRCMAYEVVRK